MMAKEQSWGGWGCACDEHLADAPAVHLYAGLLA